MVFPHLTWQNYITNLTYAEATGVARQTFVEFVGVDSITDDDGFGAIPMSQKVNKRAQGNWLLDERGYSFKHLRTISTANQEARDVDEDLPEYLFDPRLGEGQTIYIIDSGFRTTHSDFSTANGRTVETMVAPNDITLPQVTDLSLRAPEDITDWSGHGTGVASVAGGLRHGVASKANLVLIKSRNAAENPNNRNPNRPEYKIRGTTDGALQWAWDSAIEDVLGKRVLGNRGKFIINMSYGELRDDILRTICVRGDSLAN